MKCFGIYSSVLDKWYHYRSKISCPVWTMYKVNAMKFDDLDEENAKGKAILTRWAIQGELKEPLGLEVREL